MNHTDKDHALGQQIQQILIQNNLENPCQNEVIAKWQSEGYLSSLGQQVANMLNTLGLDLTDSSLAQTPMRVAKFLVKELFYGLNYANFPTVPSYENNFNYTTPVISKGITVNSTCEHHLVAIRGMAIFGYIPATKVVGLSKINRIVDFFAKRPQVQERLTKQIFVTLCTLLNTNDVAIAINASHNCIAIRGIQDAATSNITMELGGKFLSDTVLKQQIYQLALAR